MDFGISGFYRSVVFRPCQNCFSRPLDMLLDLFSFIVKMVLDAVVLLLAQIPIPVSWSLQSLFDVLPASVLSMLSAIGFTQALGIVLVALGIRFLLQLIPFIRLGS